MIRGYFAAWVSGLFIVVAHAQPMVDGLENPQQLRAAIEAQRTQKTREWDNLERECYGKFAVNDCIKKVQQQRIRGLAEFKRQLEVLDSSARMQRATEQLQKLEQKKREQQQREEESAASVPSIPAPSQQKQSKTPNTPASARTPKSPSTALQPGQTRANQQAYEQKLQDAEKRKAERDKRLLERDPNAKRLPAAP
jgi:glucan-binding YG repeat protein